MGDFEIDDVMYFMISKGGRVRNHELVTHFKNFLNHPNKKAENREKFKDYVNELATIKLDGGEKVLVLKKKYRPPSENFGSAATDALPSSPPRSSGPRKKSSNASPAPAVSEPSLASPRPTEVPPPTPASRESKAASNDSPRAQSEPPAAPARKQETDVDSIDGGMMSKVRSDENMEVRMRTSDRQPAPSYKAEETSSVTGSNASLASTESQRSVTSSTSGVVSMDEDPNASVLSVKDKVNKLNKIHSESDITHVKHHGSSAAPKKIKHVVTDDDDSSHTSGSSYIALDAEQKEWMVVCSASEYHEMNRLLSKNPGLAKLRDFTNGYTALHWAAKSGKAEVIKLIANKPGVSVNQRSHGGYTPLHLAAIHGHEHIIELLVQTFKADANLRDYSGKKAKQYLKNSASSKAQQLLVSRRLGSDLYGGKSLDDSFIRSASMRMSSRAKAMSSLLQVTSSVARQPLLRTSWDGSTEDLHDSSNEMKTPLSGLSRKPTGRDADLMPPPSNLASRRMRHSDRVKSSSRDSLPSPRSSRRNDENKNIIRAESDPTLLETTHSTV